MTRTKKRERRRSKAAGWACLAAVMIGNAKADFHQGMEAYRHENFSACVQ
jgi:hypothetical protein